MKIYFVRHGQAASNWTQDTDPGLDDVGKAQAEKCTKQLIAMGLEPTNVNTIVSPLRRARETARPFLSHWSLPEVIEDRVAEIPSFGMSLEERGPWLVSVMRDRWSNLSPELVSWRNHLLQALLEQPRDVVVFSHFIAINVAYGAACNQEEVVCFQPANCSISIFESNGQELTLLEKGHELESRIL